MGVDTNKSLKMGLNTCDPKVVLCLEHLQCKCELVPMWLWELDNVYLMWHKKFYVDIVNKKPSPMHMSKSKLEWYMYIIDLFYKMLRENENDKVEREIFWSVSFALHTVKESPYI